ncbi:glycosyl transferase [Paenibacillus sp. GSMTC-2017]|uniref:glycosyltransferase family 32 protein n=1 Tax=Paenibacillus sp. GSMTC-2017 TaxID=2794350 RepID=UPI0018D63C9E|nr:glycosyltransferase [Paenibacillus sp. GSMTC-2017]MBH5317304.1 glycosyl transferase [Paenibacillus sp. GSMTC-2017]
MENNERIPRIIHYCWFGRGEKSKKIMKCMKSWTKNLNGYQLMEWNEDNFDIESSPYVKEAYAARKFAFVSDYVRLYALHKYGGIYLDTDVEVIKSLDPLLKHEAFTGFEDEHYLQSGTMGAVSGHPWIEELLEDYKQRTFLLPDGSYDMMTNTAVISKLCKKDGLLLNGQYQTFKNGVVCYPRTYFSPYDYINGGNYITDESYSIHHFAQSWLPAHVRLRSNVKRIVSRVVGPKVISRMRQLFVSR